MPASGSASGPRNSTISCRPARSRARARRPGSSSPRAPRSTTRCRRAPNRRTEPDTDTEPDADADADADARRRRRRRHPRRPRPDAHSDTGRHRRPRAQRTAGQRSAIPDRPAPRSRSSSGALAPDLDARVVERAAQLDLWLADADGDLVDREVGQELVADRFGERLEQAVRRRIRRSAGQRRRPCRSRPSARGRRRRRRVAGSWRARRRPRTAAASAAPTRGRRGVPGTACSRG